MVKEAAAAAVQSRRSAWLSALGSVLFAASFLGWWLTFDDGGEPGTAALGGYRDRFLLLGVLLTWATGLVLFLALRPDRRTVLRIALLHGALLLTVGMLELAAITGLIDYRAVLERRESAAPAALSRQHGVRWSSRPGVELHGQDHPDLVRILGAVAAPLPYHVRTDRYGLRNAADKLDPGIVCLGDSILVAGFVPVDELVTEQLERELGIPVLNVSEVGYCPEEEWLRFRMTGLDPRGRLFVHFVFEGNDLEHGAYRQQLARRSPWPESGLVKSVLQLLHRPKARAGAGRVAMFPTAAAGPVPVHFLWDAGRNAPLLAAELPLLAEVLFRIRDQVRGGGGQYCVCFLPTKLRTLRDFCDFRAAPGLGDPALVAEAFPAGLRQICERGGIDFFDATPALVAVAARGELPFFPADTHLNPVGHAALAAALAPWLRERMSASPDLEARPR